MSVGKRHLPHSKIITYPKQRPYQGWRPFRSLIGYWPLDDNANDYSGNGRHGTATGGAYVHGPRLGKGYEFDGSDADYIDLGFNTNYTVFGVTCWILPHTIASGCNRMIASKSGHYAASYSDFPFSFSLYYNASGLGSLVMDLSKGNDYNMDLQAVIPGLPMNSLLFVGCSYQDTYKVSIYCNGLSRELRWPDSVSTNTRNWFLGRSPAPAGGGIGKSGFDGVIDDVRFFNRYLAKEDYDAMFRLSG